jgi:hypothetical protein
MSSPNTQIQQDTFHQVYNAHRDTHGYIQDQKGSVQSAVEDAVAQNKGHMITTLQSVHQDWSDTMHQVSTHLETMIGHLGTTGKGLTAVDEANTVTS